MIANNFNKADKLIFVESGCIEAFTYQEGNEFIIDNLEQGSIINFRSFLLGDVINLNMRCGTHTVIQVLTYENFQNFLLNHPRLARIVESTQREILRK